jgi:hypothetical protein
MRNRIQEENCLRIRNTACDTKETEGVILGGTVLEKSRVPNSKQNCDDKGLTNKEQNTIMGLTDR